MSGHKRTCAARACPVCSPVSAAEPIKQAERNWLVWSYEHDAWWGPNHNGYRSSIVRAGMYTEAEAKKIEASANRHPNPRHTSGKFEEALSLEDAIAREFMDWPTTGSLWEYLTEGSPGREVTR